MKVLKFNDIGERWINPWEYIEFKYKSRVYELDKDNRVIYSNEHYPDIKFDIPEDIDMNFKIYDGDIYKSSETEQFLNYLDSISNLWGEYYRYYELKNELISLVEDYPDLVEELKKEVNKL